MAVCTFLGHMEVLEYGIREKLRSAVKNVVRSAEEVDFQFFSKGEFYDLCLAAAMEAKNYAPEKKITITYFESGQVCREAQEEGKFYVPLCAVDRILPVPIEHPETTPDDMVRGKTMRQLLRQSTHVISCLYAPLLDPALQLLEYAKKFSGASIQELADPEAVDFLLGCVDQLGEREQLVLRMRYRGSTRKEIGTQLGVSEATVANVEYRASKTMQTLLRRRYGQMRKEYGGERRSCCIFTMGPVTYETLSAFSEAVSFLCHRYRITEFLVPQEYCLSGYMHVLERATYSNSGLKLTALAHGGALIEEEQTALRAKYCPPCHDLTYVASSGGSLRSGYLQAIKTALKRSDFCICNLSDAYMEQNARTQLKQALGIACFDISKKYRR